MNHRYVDSRGNPSHPQHETKEPDTRAGAPRTGGRSRYLGQQVPIAKRPRIDMRIHTGSVQFLQ